MPFYHIFILAIIQGLTEFLPVSSSGHLVLSHYLLNGESADLCWTQNRILDVAVHFGTLISVLVYFRQDITVFFSEITNVNKFKTGLLIKVIIASIPVIIAGTLLNFFKPTLLCLVTIMAWASIIFGFLLWLADRKPSNKDLKNLTLAQSLVIGLSQALALIPGVSRSGITMTTARFYGFTRTEAARFSLLLSIIAISGAGFLTGLDIVTMQDFTIGKDIILAAILSFFSGLIAIHLMMKWLSRETFTPFVIYRVVFGIALLTLIYAGIL